jgi:trans-2,3-dihydro-3-hydroxyanthranilate isomerase
VTRRYRFRQVDVFTDRPLYGNPLAVFTDADGLTDDEMQRLAREINLSETTYVLPPSSNGAEAGAAFGMRIFTPGEELPAAGHPVLGTAWVLADDGRIRLDAPRTDVRYETVLGVQQLSLEVAAGASRAAQAGTRPGDRIGAVTMVQGAAELVHVIDPDELDELGEALEIGVQFLRWKPGKGAPPRSPAAVISTGLPYLIVPVEDRGMLEDVSNERSHQVADFASSYGSDSAALVAPGNSGAIPDADVHVRVLVHPRQGIVEDPATGSAAGPIAGLPRPPRADARRHVPARHRTGRRDRPTVPDRRGGRFRWRRSAGRGTRFRVRRAADGGLGRTPGSVRSALR